MKFVLVLLSSLPFCLDELRAADYFSPAPVRFQATGFFRLATTQGRDHLVTPDGRAYVALGVNHLGAIQQDKPGSGTKRGSAAGDAYWEQTLRARFCRLEFHVARLRRAIGLEVEGTVVRHHHGVAH
jgi:hypothetical protein